MPVAYLARLSSGLTLHSLGVFAFSASATRPSDNVSERPRDLVVVEVFPNCEVHLSVYGFVWLPMVVGMFVVLTYLRYACVYVNGETMETMAQNYNLI